MRSAEYPWNLKLPLTMKKLNPYLFAFGILVMGGALCVGFLDRDTVASLLSGGANLIIFTGIVFFALTFIAVWHATDTLKTALLKRDGKLVEEEEETELEAAEESSWLQKILAKLQDAKPVEEEEEIALHHDYDGIVELDNNLPPWWLYGFYASIIFAVIYLVRYHVTESAPLPLEEYEMEMAAAAASKEEYLKTAANLVDETNVELVSEAPRIANGKAIFSKSCAVCHAQDGGGGVGPNLTDEYWIHGGSVKDIFGTIKYGVPSKGMISWKDQLSPKDIQDVASYIMEMQGTTPADPKEAQGDLYQAGAEPAADNEVSEESGQSATNAAAAEQ